MSDFIHLHCHSEFSTLDGMPKVDEYLIKVNELDMPGFALTEHGNLRSMFQLYSKCNKPFNFEGKDYNFGQAIKPIIGCEFYFSPVDHRIKGLPDSLRDKIKRKAKDKNQYNEFVKKYEEKYQVRKRWHFLVFAKNEVGYKNLLTMHYLSWKNGFYYRPRIDMKLLKKYKEGLVVTSSCIGGAAPNLFLKGDLETSEKHLRAMKKLFGDDYYIEIQPHNLDDQKSANVWLVNMAYELGIKLIATNDCHYLDKDDYKAHETLLAINSRSTIQAKDRWRFGDTGFYLRTKDEMIKAFKENHPDIPLKDVKAALENTMEIHEKSNIHMNIDKKQGILPNISVPKQYDSEKDFLISLCKKGWKNRKIDKRIIDYAKFKGISQKEAKQEYIDRLKLELDRIFKLNFVKYFLIIQDIINWARENDIMVGPGRGSSAGSLVCYLVGITSIDPIRYDLLFDRFLSEARIDYPDVDMDFEDRRRKEIFDYIFEKYGNEHVTLVGTTNRMKGRQALQDVGRVYEIPMSETLNVTRHLITRAAGDARNSQTVEDSFNEFEVSKTYNKKYPQVLPMVKKIEGKAKSVGIHPAAVQVTPFPIYKFTPIEYRKDKSSGKMFPVTSLDWRDCQEQGLIKIDILGLKTLTVIKEALESIEKRHGKKIDLEHIDLEDNKVLQAFTDLKFGGIFQFDSIGMRKMCKGFTFDNFEDTVAINALYRPGGLRSGQSKVYIGRKTGKKKIKSVHPYYDEITKNSYGTVVYQEQLMQVFMKVAGYQPSKADLVRKKVSKSQGGESLWKEREDFMKGAKKNGVDEKTADWLFKNMSFFGSYAFNKAHSAAYSTIGYWSMYLKIYYPTEFFYALLKVEKNDEDMLGFIKEAREWNVDVVLPDVNLSESTFAIIDDKKISVGLQDIKGVGDKAAKIISDNKPYKTLVDFSNKVERRIVNKGVIKALVKSGAFKSIYNNTAALIAENITIKNKRNGEKEEIIKTNWELMLEAKSEDDSELIYTKAHWANDPLTKEQEERLIATVSPIPTEKHFIEYYKDLDKLFNKSSGGKLKKVKDITLDEDKVLVKGILVDIKYNNVGDFAKEHPDEKQKKRMEWGKRYSTVNIEDETGIIRCNVGIDIFPTFRSIIDLGSGVPVVLSARPLKLNGMLFVDVMANLDNIRVVMEDENLTMRQKYRKLDKFERYFIKHPVSFIKNRPVKIKIANKRKGNMIITGLVTKVKYHWTKKKDEKMAFIELDDETGSLPITIWNNILMANNKKIQTGNILQLKILKNDRGSTVNGSKDVKLIKTIYNYVKK